MQFLKPANQLLAFTLEIGMLAAFGYWGFRTYAGSNVKWIAGIGLPLVAVVLWAVWAAPRSAQRLDLPYRVLLSWSLFGLAALALYQTGHRSWAIGFGGLALASGIIALLTER